MKVSFAVTFDYRCPFARNFHEHVVAGLHDGAEWDVEFVPFSLSQTKVGPDDPDVWDDPQRDSGLLALQAAVAVRDTQPERFLDVHRALFSLRHDEGGDLRDEQQVRTALERAGADAGAAFEHVSDGGALDTVRKEHERMAGDYGVFGVPCVIAGDSAVFVRLMNRAGGDPAESRQAVERVVAMLVGWPELNEFKHTTIPR